LKEICSTTKFGLGLLKVTNSSQLYTTVSKFNLHWPNKKIAYAGLPVYFIEPQHPAKFFWRAQYYGEGDDFKRFSYFSRAALELLYQSGKKVDIIHCHDWQTAFVVSVKII
jgi:glycogen synthase